MEKKSSLGVMERSDNCAGDGILIMGAFVFFSHGN
jgi:hypothetical protein